MAARGLAKPPVDDPVKPEEAHYASAFSAASTGDDITSNDVPDPTPVKLPDGSTYEIAVTWTPATCTYQAYESLGGDPFLREALRQNIMIFEAQANTVIESQVAQTAAQWAKCVGTEELIPADLFRAIDGGRLRTDVDPAVARTCLSDDMVKKALQTRADAELAIAHDHPEIVQAWIHVLEAETKAAGA